MATHHRRLPRHSQDRHSRLVTLLKIVAMIVVVVGTVLAFAQDQETVELCSAMPVDDPRAPEYLTSPRCFIRR